MAIIERIAGTSGTAEVSLGSIKGSPGEHLLHSAAVHAATGVTADYVVLKFSGGHSDVYLPVSLATLGKNEASFVDLGDIDIKEQKSVEAFGKQATAGVVDVFLRFTED